MRAIGALHESYDHPLVRALVGPVIVRIVGVEPELLTKLYTESELRCAAAMSVDEVSRHALDASLAA